MNTFPRARVIVATASLVGAAVSGCSVITSLDELHTSDGGAPLVDSSVPADVGASLDTGAPDSGDATALDAAVADSGPRCDPTKPFGAPVNEGPSVNTTLSEDGARLSPDEHELFLTREDAIGKRVVRYTRAPDGVSWNSPTVEANLVVTPPNPPATAFLAFDPTALSAYMSVFNGSGWQIDVASRNSVMADVWSTPTAVANLGGANATTEQPWLNATGSRLYFMSNRTGTFRIFVATKSGVFNTPVLLDPNQATEDRYPVLSHDELTLFYGAFDLTNGLRLYTKTRASIGAPWSAGVVDPSLNVSNAANSIAAPTSLSTDGCVLYFISNRPGGSGQLDVYHATRGK